jgi:hypothetical protein
MTNCEWPEEVLLPVAAYKMETFVTFVSKICDSSSETITSLTVNLFNRIVSRILQLMRQKHDMETWHISAWKAM